MEAGGKSKSVCWTPENDLKVFSKPSLISTSRALLLLHGFGKELEAGDYQNLTKVFPGATPRTIKERVAKFKREHRQVWGDIEKLPSAPLVAPAKRAPRGSKSSGARKIFNVESKVDNNTEVSPDAKTPRNQDVKALRPRTHNAGRKAPTLDGTGRPGIAYEIDDLGNVTFDEFTPKSDKRKADTRSPEPRFSISELDELSDPELNIKHSIRTPTRIPPTGKFPASGPPYFSGSSGRRSTILKPAIEPEKDDLLCDKEEKVLASPAITFHRHKRPKLEHSPTRTHSSNKLQTMIPKLAPPTSPIMERAASLTPAKKLRPETRPEMRVRKPRRSLVREPTAGLRGDASDMGSIDAEIEVDRPRVDKSMEE
ncbi:hypothetical protein LTS18_012419 [Coniosporium uncinatum]|uniref:Uncharacterized protein n=1 Tax=Coniosporium uncinatum TaxID=93489 RepID=A0ACC3D9E7_9PEZI|nr:hypothetical protein LTS18_012419 [Coniosporium uncinatum]